MTGRAAVHASSLPRLTSPQPRTWAHLDSSPAVTNVSQVRAPIMWRRTHAGSVPFWRRDATSVSIATSATAISAQRDASRLVRQSVTGVAW